MKVIPFAQGIYGATTYLVYDEIFKDGFIVDCTSSVDEIKKIIEKENINLKYILITHGHFDHVYCLNEMKKNFPNAHIFIHKDDFPLLNTIEVQCEMAGIDNITIPCIDATLDENSKNFIIGNHEIKIIHTKGHSKGGVCYLIDNILFSGDTLFFESIGRYDLFGGDFDEIKKSIKEKLFTLNDDIIVYPGHGNSTTIIHEKKHNPYIN